MSDINPFGAQLRQLRLAADMTQERLAEAVGCAAETIRSFESGRRRPSRHMALRLTQVLGLSSDDQAQFLHQARIQRGALAQAQAATPPAPPANALAELPPLLLTKLHLPRPRTDLVARPRLLARLAAGNRPLILVTAPAGFGKTTLLTSWLAQAQSAAAAQPVAFSWLALDRSDADPMRFLRGLVAALQQLEPRCGGRVLQLLQSGQPPALDAVLPLLVADLALLPAASVLVLDDYHLIEAAAIHRALAFLVEHLPPQLRLVIASRADPPLPLGRLRARGLLTELRAADLRFTLAETTAFFTQLHVVALTPEDVATLERRTEGWAVGLQLAALALQQCDDAHAFVQRFAGSNRFVVDYLAEEVLDRLPGHLHNFVLQTSILDQLCGSLCDSVLGLETSPEAAASPQAAYSQLLLLDLERANIFLIPLDDERRWYRYHHLFGEVVRARLLHGTPPSQLAALHERASHWYEQAGMDGPAISHARASGDWARAARLLITSIPRIVGRSQFHTGLDWLASLPDHVLQAYPILLVYQAGVLMYLNRVDEAAAALDRADHALATELPTTLTPPEAQVIRGQAAVIRGAVYRIKGDIAGCVAQARLALDLLPDPETAPLKLRPLAQLNALRAFKVTGEVAPAIEQRLEAVSTALRATGNLFALLNTTISLARIRLAQGQLQRAAATYAQALELVAEPDELRALVGGAAYYIGCGELYREWNDFVRAEELLRTGVELATNGALTVDADVLTTGYLSLARLQQARGELDEVQRSITTLLKIGRKRAIAIHLLERALAEQAVLQLRQGDLAGAVQWADQVAPTLLAKLDYVREDEHLNLVRVRLAQAACGERQHLEPMLALLDQLLTRAENAQRRHSSLAMLALRALLRRAQGQQTAAIADLARALELAAPQGYVRTFLDEGAPMLALLGEAQAAGCASPYLAKLLQTAN